MGNSGGRGGINGGGGGAGGFGGGAGGAGGDGNNVAPIVVPNLADSKDTVIVTGCNGMKGKEFLTMMMACGQLKLDDNSDQSARIDPEKGIGIVTFASSPIAEKAIEKLHEQEGYRKKLRVVREDEYFTTLSQLEGHHTGTEINTAWKVWNQACEGPRSKGGKGGDGLLGFFRGQNGQPGEPGPNGKGGEGGKGGWTFFPWQ